MAKPSRSDWRDPESRSEPSSTKSWQASGDDAASSALPSRRSVKRFAALISLIAIAVVIGVIILLLRPIRPACLILVGSGYEQNLLLPQNVLGWNGGLRLLKDKDISETADLGDQVRSLFSAILEPPSRMRRVDTPFELGEPDWPSTWEKILKEIDKGNEKENVVVYVSAHGYADDKDAYLLRNLADLQSPDAFYAARISFRDVLESLKKVKDPKKIVVFLDVCHVQSHWPIGLLHNDFAKRLEATYAKDIAAMGNVTVICSASSDQQSWGSEELQTTLFAHFVAKALKGEGRSANDRVNAADLFQFVEKNVTDWAKINRARAQAPMLLSANELPATLEIVRVTRQEGDADKSPSTAKFTPADVKKDWETWRDLKNNDAPHVYSPHLWRLYQETLLRYEQLLRAGDPTEQAGTLKKNLGEIAVHIRKARTLDGALNCLGNNMPMPRVLGFRPKEDISDAALRNYLVHMKDEDLEKRKEARKPFADKPQFDKHYWQTRLSRMVLAKQLEKEEFNGARVRDQLAQIAKDMDIAPQLAAEVHLVRMLEDIDSAMNKDVKTLALAVSVRLLAEEVALSMPGKDDPGELYAEVIFKRIKEDVEKADEVRRKGEDLLFGDPTIHAAKAREELIEAQKQYSRIRIDAQQLRQALALRDEVAADLPFLALWLAMLPAVDNPAESEKEIQSLRLKAEALGNRLAELTTRLERLDVPLSDVATLVTPMAADFTYLREKSQQIGEKLVRQKGGLQKNWHAIQATLSVPPSLASADAVALRVQLLESLRKISDDIAAIKDPRGNVEQDEENVALQRKLLRASLKSFDKQTQGPERNVDDAIRDFLLQQPKAILREAGDLEDVVVLQSAAQRCRVVPGAYADLVKDKKGGRVNPVERLRRLRTYHLLDWLAQRTVDDHWFEPDGTDATYYRPAATAYLDSAASLLDAKSALRKDNLDKKEKLAVIGLSVSNVLNRYWTTEQVFPVKWPVKAGKGLPAGTPMTWLEIKKGSKKGVAWRLKEREPINPWVSLDAAASFQLRKEEFLDNSNVTVVFHTLYRGQHKKNPVTIECPPPDVIARHTRGPAKVGLAVRMEKALDYGAISIVVDTSGSMLYVHPWKNELDTARNADESKGEKSRYHFAMDALKQVLEKIPNGTRISVIAFESNKTDTWPYFVEKPHPWDKGAADSVITKLRRNELDKNYSPIANAIVKGMTEGFPGVTVGPKLVLVLTDGYDNISVDRKKIDDNSEGVKTLLRQTNYKVKRGIDVMVIGFLDKGGKPVVGKKTEFDVALEQFDHVKYFTDRSGFFPQPKGAELGKTIEELIIRPYVQVKSDAKVIREFQYGRPVNYLSDATLNWKPFIDASDYEANVLNAPRTGVELKMPAGHNLFAVLKRKEDRTLYMERGLLARQPEVEGNYQSKSADGWLVTLLENHQSLTGNTISQLISLEKTKLEEDIRQTHPGFTWLELETVKSIRPDQTLEWNNVWSLPAPAFQTKMRWPQSESPKLSAWFWPEVRDRFLLNDSIVTRRKIKVPFEADNETDPVENISWERAQDRLVVRLRFPLKKPIAAGLKDYPDYATEHRHYLKAGRGTAYFYGLPQTLQEVNLTLIDIEAFKAAAANVEFRPTQPYDGPKIFYRPAD